MVFVFKRLKKSTTSGNLSRASRIFYTEQTEHIRIFFICIEVFLTVLLVLKTASCFFHLTFI